MRILATDGSDNTLLVFEAVTVGYDPEENAFWAEGSSGDIFYFWDVSSSEYKGYMRSLLQDGFVDMSNKLVDVPDDWGEQDEDEDNEDDGDNKGNETNESHDREDFGQISFDDNPRDIFLK